MLPTSTQEGQIKENEEGGNRVRGRGERQKGEGRREGEGSVHALGLQVYTLLHTDHRHTGTEA